MNHTDEDDLIRRYLLGQLPEGEHQSAEQRVLTDRVFYERVLLVENDLADEYAAGLLSTTDKENFERLFLPVPRRHTQLQVAKLLTSRATKKPGASVQVMTSSGPKPRGVVRRFFADRRIWPTTIAAALLLPLAAGLLWLLFETRKLAAEIQTAQAARETQDRQERALQAEVARLQANMDELTIQLERDRSSRHEMEKELSRLRAAADQAPPAKSVASFVLTPGMLREGGQVVNVQLTPDITRVRFQLRLDGEKYRVYRATIQSDEGTSVFRKNLALRSKNGTSIVVTVPASALSSGDYVARLEGSNDGGGYTSVGTYYFRVAKEAGR